MTTSLKTIIMIANMNIAAIVDTAFSRTPTALNSPSSTSISPGYCCCGEMDDTPIRLLGRNARDRRVELLKRVAAPLAARIQPFRPGLRYSLEEVLEPGAGARLQTFESDGRFQRLLRFLVSVLHLAAGQWNELVRNLDHRLLDLRREFLPGGIADRIRNDEAAETQSVGRILDELVGSISDNA